MKTVDRLMSLRVADIMARSATTVSTNQTMSEAATVFHEKKVNSAPVVDDQGHCVGVLSAADFVQREFDYSQREDSVLAGDEPAWQEANHGQSRQFVPRHEDFVEYHMSPAVQSVHRSASLLSAANMMCGAHIHHLIVIDDQNRPEGVVSSLDIVAAVKNAIDEQEGARKRDFADF